MDIATPATKGTRDTVDKEQRCTHTAPTAQAKAIIDDGVLTEIKYAVRDPKHEHEKAYDVRYNTKGVIPITNVTIETRAVVIHNFRPHQNSQSFNEYGFSLEKADCPLSTAVFEDQKIIKELYYPALERILWQRFPDAAGVLIREHNLRKRHAQFPALKEEVEVEFTQPATLAHIDCSLDSATRTACAAFNVPADQYRRVLAVNFWKSLQGTGNDWPLALCDRRTINYDSDILVADVVYHNRYTENEKMYYSPNHKWYYIKNLSDDEIIMFLQKDSEIDGGGGIAHTSFNNPIADKNAALRTSIELRAFVVFT